MNGQATCAARNAATASPPCAAPLRRHAFRAIAVLLALLPFLLIEAVCIVCNFGQPLTTVDPFVGLRAVRPLFILDDQRSRYQVAPYRLSHFAPDSFAAVKSPDAFRIFCIGDSTVQGNPWSIETSFTQWLQLSLEAAEPSRDWEVINCGGISYASYRMVPILEEILHYAPDLVIVHASHNEFLEARTYEHIKDLPEFVVTGQRCMSRLRSFRLLQAGYRQLSGHAASEAPKDRAVLEAEVEALLDYRGGLESYRRDDGWRDDVIAHYEFNLRRMVRIARDARVPLVLMNPVSNLRDSPPFKSQARAGMTARDAERFDDLWTQARSHYGDDYAQALRLLRQAAAFDDQHAGLRYDIAKCLDAMGLIEDAKREYIAAKELDVCPLRILERMNRFLIELGRASDTPVVDVRGLFEQLSRNHIPGGEWFADHVHPSIRGYQAIGTTLADELARRGVVRPGASWQSETQQRYARHLASLDTLYFVRGQQHLEGLTRWAQGRVLKERPSPTGAHP